MSKVNVKKEDGLLNITLNRPEIHNAFDREMIVELTKAFYLPQLDPGIRVVLVRGSGKNFCAGADLEYMRSMIQYSYEENVKDAEYLFDLFYAGLTCPAPVLVQAHGHVMGGGVGLVAIGDYAVAESATLFCFSEVKIGLAPAVISSFIVDKMKLSMARELMMSGRFFSVSEALNGGLIHFFGSSQECENQLKKNIERFMEVGPEAVRETKKLLLKIVKNQDWQSRKKWSTEVIAQRRVSQEGQEGISAFLEKKSVSWIKKSTQGLASE